MVYRLWTDADETEKTEETPPMNRRDFVKLSAAAATAPIAGALARAGETRSGTARPESASRSYNAPYEGAHLSRVAFPLGGIGAGMVCVEGAGGLSHLSLRHRPDVFNEPSGVFSALWIKQTGAALVLEGPVPDWKKFGLKGPEYAGSANGGGGSTLGAPAVWPSGFLQPVSLCGNQTHPAGPAGGSPCRRVESFHSGRLVSFESAGGGARVHLRQHQRRAGRLRVFVQRAEFHGAARQQTVRG